MFPDAGSYILGVLASHRLRNCLWLSWAGLGVVHAGLPTLNLVHLLTVDLVAGFLAGYFCSTRRRSAMDLLSSLAGSGTMALTLYWSLYDLCCRIAQEESSSPLGLLQRIVEVQDAWDLSARLSFLLLWVLILLLGVKLRRALSRTERERFQGWFQEQLRRAPKDCALVPRWRREAPKLVPVETGDVEKPEVEEEDFGMYLLPRDLESMKLRRAQSIPCLNSHVPLRQASLPVFSHGNARDSGP